MRALPRTQWITAVGVFALLASACDDTPPPPAPPGAGAQGLAILTQGSEAAAGAAEEVPEAPPPPTGEAGAPGEESSDLAYAYSPIGKRDPFRSLFDQLQREESGPPLTELQRFEIDQLRLVAIISRIATPYAMVEDPRSKGHTLTRGTLIGKNWGRVAQINPECVVIKEEYRDYTGRKVTNNTSMCLPKPAELKLD